jgi:hypothetical protein
VTFQLQITLGVVELIETGFDINPLQTVWVFPPAKTTVGAGITVIEKVSGIPLQPEAFGVTR